MLISRIIRLAALTAAGVLGLTAVAAADEVAYTKSSANLREGPGTRYAIIETLPRNTEVYVEACNASWCSVTVEDDDDEIAGFISKSLLKANRRGPDRPFRIEITINPFGNLFGPPPRRPGPPGPPQGGPPPQQPPAPPQGQQPPGPPPQQPPGPPQGQQPPGPPPQQPPGPPQGQPSGPPSDDVPDVCLNPQPGVPLPPFCNQPPNGPGGPPPFGNN